VDFLGTYATNGPAGHWLGDTPVNRDFSQKLE
jgi:hypothetical protein